MEKNSPTTFDLASLVRREEMGLPDWRSSLIFLALCIAFYWLGPSPSMATEVIVFALFALSFNILLGYTGLLSFGQAAYFGLGAYAASLFLIHVANNLWLALLAAVLVAGLVSLVIGFLCLKHHGVAFAFLTLAFAEMIYFLIFELRSITGGDDGLSGIPRPKLILPGISLSLADSMVRYFFVLAVVALCYLIIYRVIESPFGRVLAAMRENEERVTFLGLAVRRFKLGSFVLSGTLAGLAGALFSINLNFVPIEILHWSVSGEVVIMALVGGMATFFGPAIGAALFILLRDILSSYIERWQLVMGILFAIVVLFLPLGLSSVAVNLKANLARWRGHNVPAKDGTMERVDS